MWAATELLLFNSTLGGIMALLALYHRVPVLILPITIYMAVTCVVACLAIWLRAMKPRIWAERIYIFQLISTILIISQFQQQWVSTGQPFQAFIGLKVLSVLLATKAPTSQRVGWASLFLLFIAPLIQYGGWTPEQQLLVGPQEPWMTLLVVCCSGVIYFQRLRSYRETERQAKMEALTYTSHRYAHLLLGLQHLSNTPLQVIESSLHLLRDQQPESKEILDRMEKSFVPLRRISQILSYGKIHLSWQEVQLPTTVEDFEREIQQLALEMDKGWDQIKMSSEIASESRETRSGSSGAKAPNPRQS